MVPFLRVMRQKLRYRVIGYLDDFLVALSRAGAAATRRDFKRARKKIQTLLTQLGLRRHPTKGEWEGATRVEHLGVVIDSMLMKFYVAPRKITKIRKLAQALLNQARIGRRWVSRDRLASFAGSCVSLSLAMPFARFYSRSIYWDLLHNCKERAGSSRSRTRLSHQFLRDLRFWKKLTSEEKEGREIRPHPASYTLHTYAADMGFGWTLGPDKVPGQNGLWESQGVWGWNDRAACISLRELRAIRHFYRQALWEGGSTKWV